MGYGNALLVGGVVIKTHSMVQGVHIHQVNQGCPLGVTTWTHQMFAYNFGKTS
jgi:hypothetical protein